MMSDFTFVDLFAGIGGFRSAMVEHGGRCVGFSEIAKDAIEAYTVNYNEGIESNFGDITKIDDLPPHDLLTAGVPCQSWSIAGKNLGFDDSRGQLWNDTLYLLNKSRPKAFIFENVKGLADPRNEKALGFIMNQIREAGYYAHYYLLNSFDYGVPQNRVRIYIIGFREEKYFKRFRLPQPMKYRATLGSILFGEKQDDAVECLSGKGQSISTNKDGRNNYFLFNDLRGGDTTIHSWDLIRTSAKEKYICNLLLRNRRKDIYGPLDGNPLSLRHFQQLDASISESDLQGLVDKGILKPEKYSFRLNNDLEDLDIDGIEILRPYRNSACNIDSLKLNREFKLRKISVSILLDTLEKMGRAQCLEVRYDFRNTKISTGLNGINRIFLPSANLYPTLVASDTNDYITPVSISGSTDEEYRHNFMTQVYLPGNYRRISKEEACLIQGFPKDFILPASRARWMKLIGNSVAVQMISQLVNSIIETGVFHDAEYNEKMIKPSVRGNPKVIQLELF